MLSAYEKTIDNLIFESNLEQVKPYYPKLPTKQPTPNHRLRILMGIYNLNVSDLARIATTPHSTVRLWLSKNSRPARPREQQVADYFEVDADWLFQKKT